MSRSRIRPLPLLSLAVERFPCYSRDELYSFILCGELQVDGGVNRDPKQPVPVDAELELISRRYVSRGGDKLATAYAAWKFPIAGSVFLDAGASTGGFTHFLLLHGARAVHTVDVGYNQLDYRLRSDSRVVVHERTNIMTVETLEPQPEAAVGDLSFRSLIGAASHILSLTLFGWGVFLLKPQFELKEKGDSFSGVVTDRQTERRVVKETMLSLAADSLRCEGLLPSAVRGRKGNQEYLIWLVIDKATPGPLLKRRAGELTDRLFPG